VKEGDAVVIPAGASHNVINTDDVAGLKMYTLYSPAHHKDGIIRSTKRCGKKNGEEFDGVTTESFNKHVVRDESFILPFEVFNNKNASCSEMCK
jgi:hypothetical protein